MWNLNSLLLWWQVLTSRNCGDAVAGCWQGEVKATIALKKNLSLFWIQVEGGPRQKIEETTDLRYWQHWQVEQ